MTFSFELIPPKKEEGLEAWVNDIIPKIRNIFDTITIVDKPNRHNSVTTACALKKHFHGTIIPHLTLRNRTRKDFEKMIKTMHTAGISHVLALKGDAPLSGELKDVCELITLCRENNLTIGAALNQRSETSERIQQKIAAGATFFITQPIWNENAKLSFPGKLSLEHVKIVPTLLVLGDHKKLAEYASKYPEMGITQDYLVEHARDDTTSTIAYAKKLKQKLEAQGVIWLHFMGTIDLVLNLF